MTCKFTQAYIEALYFTDTGDTDQPAAGAELSPETRAQCERECKAFQEQHAALLERAYEAYPSREWSPEEQAGHDFWLTRNRHGAGFWDRGLPEGLSKALTDAAHAAGERWVYLGDDGLIYLSPED